MTILPAPSFTQIGDFLFAKHLQIKAFPGIIKTTNKARILSGWWKDVIYILLGKIVGEIWSWCECNSAE